MLTLMWRAAGSSQMNRNGKPGFQKEENVSPNSGCTACLAKAISRVGFQFSMHVALSFHRPVWEVSRRRPFWDPMKPDRSCMLVSKVRS